GEEGVGLRRRHPVEDADLGPAALAGGDDDFVLAVAIDVAGGDVDAASKEGVKGEELGEDSLGAGVEHLDVRAAQLAGARDDVGLAVAVDVAGRHADAAAEVRLVGEVLADDGAVGVEDADVRAAAGAGAGNDLGLAVAVDVGGGDVDAAEEADVVGEEFAHQ